MNKIKVIFTGGTIGSLCSGNDINTNSEAKYLLLNEYGKMGKACQENLKDIECESPINILSENAIYPNVLQMAEEIKKYRGSGIKGIIMTHGSDTLAYSCAYLSFLVGDIDFPVVMVASNYILTDKRANGVLNFACAVDFINQKNPPSGVFVAYKNPKDGYVSVHLGTRMKEPLPLDDSFYSYDGFRFAKWQNGKLELENTTYQKQNIVPLNGLQFTKSVLFVTPFTGLDYNVYKNGSYEYVVHSLYHSGTANTQNYIDDIYQTNFLNFADYCYEKHIPIYLCNIQKKDVNYNSTNQMLQKNIKFVYDVLPNVALAKVNIAMNFVDPKDIDKFLTTNICGEVLN